MRPTGACAPCPFGASGLLKYPDPPGRALGSVVTRPGVIERSSGAVIGRSSVSSRQLAIKS
jgi:hypothetical protein